MGHYQRKGSINEISGIKLIDRICLRIILNRNERSRKEGIYKLIILYSSNIK